MSDIDWEAVNDSKKAFLIIFLIGITLANCGLSLCIIRKWNALPKLQRGLLGTFVVADFLLALVCLVIETMIAFDDQFKKDICLLFVFVRSYMFQFMPFGYCTGLILLAIEILTRKRIYSCSESTVTVLSLLFAFVPWALSSLIVFPISFAGVHYEVFCHAIEMPLSRRKALNSITNLLLPFLALLFSAVTLLVLRSNSNNRSLLTGGGIPQTLPRQGGELISLQHAVTNNVRAEKGQTTRKINNGYDKKGIPETTPETFQENHMTVDIPSTNVAGAYLVRHSAPTNSHTIPNSPGFSSPCGPPATVPHDPSLLTHGPPTASLYSVHSAAPVCVTSSNVSHLSHTPPQGNVDTNLTKEALFLFMVSLACFVFIIPSGIFALVFFEKGQYFLDEVVFHSLDLGTLWWFLLKDIVCAVIWMVGMSI
ncbi:uncharacterized protein LOC101852972 isoform X2 [Aplysia californica]|nr:uncharacterized protein LOC101852972 isoform X2 [Aplysia californica]